MRAIIAEEDGLIRLRVFPFPQLQDGQIEIRTTCSLISPGTELHYAKEALKNNTHYFLGYCASGYVERVGNYVKGFSIGDRVIAMGWGYAIHAERICVPHRLCTVIPDELPFDDAVFANLAATALHAIHRAKLSGSERVLAIGGGLIGQLVAQCAQIYTSDVYMVDCLEGRLKAAQTAGVKKVFNSNKKSFVDSVLAATEGKGVNTVFLCNTGEATSVIADSIKVITTAPDGQKRGTLVCVGRFDAHINFNVDMGNVDIRYAARCGSGYRDDDYTHGRLDYPAPDGEASVSSNIQTCVQLIHDQAIRLDTIHTHRIAFDDALTAYELFKSPDSVIGVTLHYNNPI
ncbi:MAG: zinc-binding dehydrogenase [Nostoc sp.]|uniref:zinc-binding dehydrogenase n=1 Tax=Nostoc sp. TaxID=1180 RepID=UPI002FFC5E8E